MSIKNKSFGLLVKNGIRTDGRGLGDLRKIKIDLGILRNADGSVYIEHGKNKIIVAVYGPRELHPKRLTLPDRALLRCRYHMAPFSTDERKRPAPSRREIEISKVITEALEPSVFVEHYPRTVIDVFIEVLESDGGTRCASITAASIALAEAGIALKDLVVACAAGKIDENIALDLNSIEDQKGEADLPVAIMPNKNVITLLQMDGNLNEEQFQQTLELAIDGCKQIYLLQEDVLKKRYMSPVENSQGALKEE